MQQIVPAASAAYVSRTRLKEMSTSCSVRAAARRSRACAARVRRSIARADCCRPSPARRGR
eukprot:scaffold22286_cov52-Phaeocystis_antarctica.AAC.1